MILRRFATAATLGLLAVIILAFPATAGVNWCRSDPIVRLNGTDVQILVAVPEEFVKFVNGPIHVKIKAPKDVEREIIMTDAGFNGHGEKVSMNGRRGAINADGSFDIEVRVHVPFSDEVGAFVKVPGEGAPVHITYGDDGMTKTVVRVQGTN